MSSLDSEIMKLAAAIQTNEADLAAATKLRKDEKSEFEKTEAELSESIDQLVGGSLAFDTARVFVGILRIMLQPFT